MRLFLSGIWILLLTTCGFADTYVRQPEVDILHYDIALELTDTSDSIHATTKIQVRMQREGVSAMRLDFACMQIDSLLVQGSQRDYTCRDGNLSFSFGRKYGQNETAVVEVQYRGKPEQGLLIGRNKHGARVVFAENWPDRAHYWFPCIDHPYEKATAQVTVTAPQKYDVVSNGQLVQTKLLSDGRKRTQWTERKAIPPYCIVVGIAEFSIARQKRIKGVQLLWYSYPQDSQAAASKFRRTAPVLAYFNSLIGPYPYKKLAQVQATVNFDGMENSSVIFYEEPSFQVASVSEDPVFHEIAHQWFGDSITQMDWDHLWLSEGFATYFEALAYEHLDGPGVLNQMMAAHAKKLDESKQGRSVAVIDPAQTDLMKKLNAVNYLKGAWILHMLRGMLGDARFFSGIRRYYRLYEGKNASSEDLQKAMESVSGISLSTFFKQWLYQPGWPEYSLSWHWNQETGEAEITVRQRQTSGLFDMIVAVEFDLGNRKASRRLRISDSEQTFRIPLTDKPLSIEIDPDCWVLKSVVSESAR